MATLLVGIALAYIAGRILAKSIPAGSVDTSSPTFARRGSYTAYVLGRRRIGHVVGWVGARVAEKRSSGGGKGGGGGKAKYNVYFEKAWHQLCPGPGNKLHAIYGADGANLLAGLGVLTRETHPSGTYVQLGAGFNGTGEPSGFWIYWGECDQPVCAALVTALAEAGSPQSQWPGLMYVFWDSYSLGQVTTWPRLEYDVEMLLNTDMSPLTQSAPTFLGGSSAYVKPISGINSNAFRGIDAVDEFGVRTTDPEDDWGIEISGSSVCVLTEVVTGSNVKRYAFTGAKRPFDEIGPIDRVFEVTINSISAATYQAFEYGLVGASSSSPSSAELEGSKIYQHNSTTPSPGDVISVRISTTSNPGSVVLTVYNNGVLAGGSGIQGHPGGSLNWIPFVSVLEGGNALDATMNLTGPLTFPLASTIPWGEAVPSYTVEPSNEGVNPAHALYYLHTAQKPFGADAPPSDLDLGAYEALGVLCESLHYPINVLGADGVTMDKVIADILQDIGIVLPSANGLISPLLVREETDPIVLSADIVSEVPIERTAAQEGSSIENLSYQFSNVDNKFAAQDIYRISDAAAVRNVSRERRIPLPTLTHYQHANLQIGRKIREAMVGTDTTVFSVFREGSRLVCGQAFVLPSGAQFRVLSVNRVPVSDVAKVDCLPDIYADQASVIVQNSPSYPQLPSAATPVPDIFNWVEAPKAFAALSGHGLIVFRANAVGDVLGASTHDSAGNVTYTNMGASSAEGLALRLLDPIDGVSDGDGPICRVIAGELTSVLDLSGSPDEWEAGIQLLLIGSEIIYLESITVLGPDLISLGNMKRGRSGSAANRHDPFELAIIMQSDSAVVNTNGLVSPSVPSTGAVDPFYIKTEPYTLLETLDLSNTDPVSKEILGASQAPLPAQGLSANSATNRYSPAGDVVLNWTGVSSIPELADAVDQFKVQILSNDGQTVIRTITQAASVGANSYTYTNANILTDYGYEPEQIHARVMALSASSHSLAAAVRVIKDGAPAPFQYGSRVLESVMFDIPAFTDEQLLYNAFGD